MRVYQKKSCPHFKPLPEIPYMLRDEPKCSHCAYFSGKNCHSGYFDALEYADDEF